MFVLRHKSNRSVYVHQNLKNTTHFFADAAKHSTGQTLVDGVRNRDQLDLAYFEVIDERHVIRDVCREFIAAYERDSNRTHGEKAACAAMKTLVFHSNDELQVLQNGVLRNIQVMQAFAGLLSRMETPSEAHVDTTPAIQEQAGNEQVPVLFQRREDTGGADAG